MSGGWAGKVLADLVELRQTGLNEPIPFAPKTSAEYAADPLRRPRRSRRTRRLLRTTWDRERDEVYERFFGTGVSFDDMLGRALASTPRCAATSAEPRRFGTLARRVFQPLLSAEELR